MTTIIPATGPDVWSLLRDVLSELDIDAAAIRPEALLRDDLDIDSAELVEIVAAVRGGLAPEGKVLKSIRTVAQLAAFLSGQHDVPDTDDDGPHAGEER